MAPPTSIFPNLPLSATSANGAAKAFSPALLRAQRQTGRKPTYITSITKILIDNGYGVNTPGKCSPDGVFREYKYTREIAAAVVQHLQYRGFDAALVTPEEYDVSLRARMNV